MRFVVTLLLLASPAMAQSTFSHSGWNFTDTMQNATDVLVADIVEGSAIDDGSRVSVKARLRVVRVLGGTPPSGGEVALEWQYRPGPTEGPSTTSKVPQVRGLWFLRKQADGKLQPLQASAMMMSLGGYYLPAGETPRYYSDTSPLQYKIACEIAPVLEDLAMRNSADLAPHPPTPPVRGVIAPWVQTRMRYQALTMALQGLEKSATAEAYTYFSGLSDANLKMVGIQGRLNAGDTSAIFDLEKNLSMMAGSGGNNGGMTVMGLDLRKDLPAAHALARIALSETSAPGVEGSAAFQLALTRSLEFLPYLIVMLGHNNSGTRDSTLMSFCQLLQPMGDVPASRLWQPEMAEYCPTHSPMNDAATQEKDIRFWKQWWESHREEIAKAVTLPVAVAPTRYSLPRSDGWQEITEIPMEVRFMSLLSLTARQDHYHDASGAQVEGSLPVPDPVGHQLTPADQEIYSEVISATRTRLAGVDKGAQDMMNAARIAGTPPDLERSKQLNQQRETALKDGVTGLRNRLSPAGWQAVEKFMLQMGIGMGRMAGPAR